VRLLRLASPVSGHTHEAQALNIFHNDWTPDGPIQDRGSGSNILTDKPFLCAQCPAAYRRLGDLTRHQKEKHSAASSKYLCHIELCPRSIAGEGFGRMHHLVAHLKSNKHGMDAKEAAYTARQHNLPKSKVAGNGGLGAEEAL
jgi:uncharacterized Zn-finger protein